MAALVHRVRVAPLPLRGCANACLLAESKSSAAVTAIEDDALLEVVTRTTTPYDGQKPGTSGLRKKTKVWMEGTYTHNFVTVRFCAPATPQRATIRVAVDTGHRLVPRLTAAPPPVPGRISRTGRVRAGGQHDCGVW